MDRTTTIRDNLHEIINKIENNDLLEMVFNVLESNKSYAEGSLIKSLKVEEREELYQSYDDSLSESNLVDLDSLKKKHAKWLEE